MEQVERLAGAEALALAGLLRMVIREDGRFSEEERSALALVATSIALDDGAPTSEAYRSTAPAEPIGEEGLYALIERAGEELPDDDAIRAAAVAVTRPAARATIHALLFEVAASDMISKGESDVLDWLAATWELEIPRELEGEKTDVG